MTLPDPNANSPKDEEKPKPKGNKSFPEFKKEGLIDFVKSNTRDTAAYVLLVIGMVFLFFEPLFGGILIGLVAGIYFSEEINFLLKNGNEFIEEQGIVRSIVLGITALALFISAPGIFIGAALAIALKHLFGSNEEKENKPPGNPPPPI